MTRLWEVSVLSRLQHSNDFSKTVKGLLKLAPDNSMMVVARESTCLEFKESFGSKSMSKYAKTMAAFANTRGGCIIFGISDKPRRVRGIQSGSFEKLDPAYVTSFLNDRFAPEIRWEHYTEDVHGMTLGVIHIQEAKEKPVVCTCNSGNTLKNGAIYYRYRGVSTIIRYPELINLIKAEREKEKQYWVDLIKHVASIGIENVTILDTMGGGLYGGVYGSRPMFYADKQLLQKVKVIKEGQFAEITGGPTLRLVGDLCPIEASVVQPVRSVKQPCVLTSMDVMRAFLTGDPNLTDPMEYIKYICHGNKKYLPIWFFAHRAGLDVSGMVEFIQEQPDGQGKRYLLERVESGDHFRCYGLSENTAAGAGRKRMLSRLQTGSLDVRKLDDEEAFRLAQAIQGRDLSEAELDYLNSVLMSLLETRNSRAGSAIAAELRKTICYLDRMIYGSMLLETNEG